MTDQEIISSPLCSVYDNLEYYFLSNDSIDVIKVLVNAIQSFIHSLGFQHNGYSHMR